MATKDLLSPCRAAVDAYGMIKENDTVAVGVSGGKDSVALLTLLSRLRRFYPVPFSLKAITLDLCFDGEETDYSPISRLCEQLEVPYIVKRTRLWDAVKEHGEEEKPCSLCAKLRRGTLHRIAVEEGCRTVALGHHRDDAAETVLMNLLSGATYGCFSPKSYLDRREITVIRPLVYIPERDIEAFVRREQLPVIASRCPVNGQTDRAAVHDLFDSLSARYGDVAGKLVTSLQKSHQSNW